MEKAKKGDNKENSSDVKIKKIMSVIKSPKTISYLAKLTNGTERDTRRLIARIRKHHPIFAFSDGTGYKYASKKEAEKLIKFELSTIKNHKKNLKVLLDYVGRG